MTWQETTPFVEVILDTLSDDHVPFFAGQLRLESALINRFDVVLQTDDISKYPLLSDPPFHLEWLRVSADLRVAVGYVRLADEMPVTFWWCTPRALGSVMLHATGPTEFTSALKRKAQLKGFVLRQDGLFFNLGTEKLDDGSERGVFRMLDVPWMEPADRNVFSKIDYRDQEVIEREVSSSKGGTYLVRIHGDKANCPCPGFRHRHACRHLTQVRQELGLPTPLRTDVLS